jgi:hypothetical protein
MILSAGFVIQREGRLTVPVRLGLAQWRFGEPPLPKERFLDLDRNDKENCVNGSARSGQD